jgi:cytosine/adenosine deaminase-related metal-dependent hydrolase
MAVGVAGTIAPMAPGDEERSFKGRVWLGDDGSVVAVTRGRERPPAALATAPVVDVGDAVVHPGFVDLHTHLGYNTLPLWAEPAQEEPFLHHDIWPSRPTYKPAVSWPAWVLADLAPECLLAYGQVRALAGGTTAMQGWPGLSRDPSNALVRRVEDEKVGPLADPVRASTLTLDVADLSRVATALDGGRTFVYHCAEGQPSTRVTEEFEDLARAGCLQPGLAAIHCCALDRTHFQRWRRAVRASRRRAPGTVVWSPFSNLWLYGLTTDVPAALDERLAVCLGTDWGPSGTKNLLGEIKVARIWSDLQGWGLTDHQLVRMITSVPGDALAPAWQQPVGRIVPGAIGDVAVVSRRTRDVWRNLVTAREDDVLLVTVGGRPRYGTKQLMDAAGARNTTSVTVGPVTRRVTLVRPDDPTRTWSWKDVLARMEAVRQQVAVTPPVGPGAIAGGGRPVVRPDVGDPGGTASMSLSLDMPGGPGATAGPPPAGRTVDVPPIEPLHHGRRWLRSLRGRGFHGGVLDGLAPLLER